jgi:hypothetical protein
MDAGVWLVRSVGAGKDRGPGGRSLLVRPGQGYLPSREVAGTPREGSEHLRHVDDPAHPICEQGFEWTIPTEG